MGIGNRGGMHTVKFIGDQGIIKNEPEEDNLKSTQLESVQNRLSKD